MIRAFLFDIGNVLLKFDFSLALARVAADCAVHDPVDILAKIDQIKLGYEDGAIDRPAFLRSAFDVLKYRGTEAQFVSAWEEIFEPNEPMVTLLETLRGRFPLYLLSNTSDIHREYIFRHYPFFASFDAGIYSYEVRTSKPHRAIYEIAARQLRIEPAATFFIDDLLPNIEAAREFGFHAHHYHAAEHGKLLAELRDLGIA